MKKRKDGRWTKKVTINGKQKFFFSTAKTEREAIKDINAQMLHFSETQTNKHKFSYIADEWNSEHREKVGEINYRKATRAVYTRILEYFADEMIEDIGAPEINILFKQLINKRYSHKTIATYKNVLNMIFCHALLNGYIKYNPVPDVKLPSGLPRTQREAPDDTIIYEITKHTEGFDLFPYFCLYSGLRRSEALAIRRENIDFKKKLIYVNHHLIHDGNKPIYEPVLKTKSAEREVILLDRLADVIPKDFSGFLFSMNGDGAEPITASAYKKRWDKYCKTYGVKVTAHQLRHGYATMLFEAGIDLKDAQDLMGHSDINLTRQIYTHIRNKRKEETAKKLNAFSF